MNYNFHANTPLCNNRKLYRGMIGNMIEKKHLLAMKLTLFLLFVFSLQVIAGVKAQQVSLKMKDKPLKSVLRELRKQSHCSFIYEDYLLEQAPLITINIKDKNMQEALQLVFRDQPFTYRMEGNVISIVQKTEAGIIPQTLFQQQITVRGSVADSLGKPMQGAGIHMLGPTGKPTTIHAFSDALGQFVLYNVPLDASLEITYVGYIRRTVKAAPDLGVITLRQKPSELQEVVVTGVAVGTSKMKVPFSVTKINAQQINTVPGLDLSQTLRAKVAGISIYQAEGDEGASVSLRGAKSFYGSINPLIVVDGYVSNLGLSDLNPQDVESIEVVRGAAAAALYGTRAEGGVIQVITKKGRDAQGRVSITLDNEYGSNNVQRTPKLATMHRWKTDPDDEFGFAYQLDQAGNATSSRVSNLASNGFSPILSPYKTYYDNVDLLLSDKAFFSNFVSMATAGDKYNIYMSFQNQQNKGVLEPINANIRRTAKMNLQLRPSSKWEIEANVHYFYNSRPSDIASGGDGLTYFANVLQQEPFINLNEKDENGDWIAIPRGYKIQGANLDFNPLYQYSQQVYKNYNSQVLAGGRAKYSIIDQLSFEVAGSINQTFSNLSRLYPKGYQTALEDLTLNNGNLYISSGKNRFINGQAQVNYHDKFGDFDFAASAKSVYEFYNSSFFSAQGYNFSVPLYKLENTQAVSRTITGSDEMIGKTVNYGYFLNIRTGYRDKLFLDVLGRIDQSSRYGSNAQTAFFPRVSLAYRLTKDYNLGKNVNDLKLRASWGRAGSIPAYNAKESLVTVSNTGISISQNENTYLERSYTSELEVGFDATFFKKLDVTFNYAKANSRGDFVRPPVFVPTMGTTPAYKNFGLITSNSIELETRANGVVNNRNFSLDVGLTFARTRSKIVELGEGLPNFSSSIYRKEAGLSPWAFYGQKVLTSLSELQVVDGKVTNAAGGAYTPDDFVVNGYGHVVLKNTLGTANERPLFLQENGAAKSVVIGDGQPDFTTGLNTTMTFFRRFQFYATLDWQQGGSKYNQTTQYLTSNDRSMLWQEYAQDGMPQGYAQALYNGNATTSVWVEDNSYLSLREVSLSYTLPKIKGLNALQNVRIALTGRNLYTWSKFSGSNPEGYYEFYPYPLYRTYTAKLTLNF